MHIAWKTIDINDWERRNAFLGFKDFDFPYSVVGTDLDISKALAYWKQNRLSPYLSLVYSVCHTVNQIPAFRQRIRNGIPIEHECIHADFTVPSGSEAFAIKVVEYTPDFRKFYEMASSPVPPKWASPGDGTNHDDHLVYMSCLPWVKFNHIVQPTDRRSGSIPRIVWGRFTEEKEKITLPISVQTHHSLVDGIHVGRFVEHLQNLLDQPSLVFKK